MACVWYCSIYAIGWKVVMHTTKINQMFVDTEVGIRVLVSKMRYCLGFLRPSVELSQIAMSSIIQTSSSVHSSTHRYITTVISGSTSLFYPRQQRSSRREHKPS